MAVPTFSYTTGPSTLLDAGAVRYNNCLFSPLFESTVSGHVVKDNANRTTKFVEYDLSVDGYVTLPAGAANIGPTMDTLRRLLTAQGGSLAYQGRGLDLVVNQGGGAAGAGGGAAGTRDAAWGPSPELLEFQPLGGGLSAKVRWRCKVRVPEVQAAAFIVSAKNGRVAVPLGTPGAVVMPLLQFNFDTSVSYGEDGYSTLSVRGTLEIPLTRVPSQGTRTLTVTADDYRAVLDSRIFAGIDLKRFRVTRREYPLSRDKRTIEFSVQAEEKPYMDLPVGCTVATGTYSVRPSKAGAGLCNWMCTLRATYTVKGPHRQGDAGEPRRTAWFAFLALLRLRMANSKFANIGFTGDQNPGRGAKASLGRRVATSVVVGAAGVASIPFWGRQLRSQSKDVKESKAAWLVDFSFDEGLYNASKTTSFSATWRLVTTFSHILLASGLWRKMPENDATGRNLWAASVSDVSGSTSWLPNLADPKMDVIVDFGGG